MKRFLWEMNLDFGRMGEVEGLFVATESEITRLVGKEIYFGEILGKHSEICGTFEKGDAYKVDLDSETVEKVSAILGDTWSGYNPTEYVRYVCEQCGESCEHDEFNIDMGICYNCEEENEEEDEEWDG